MGGGAPLVPPKFMCIHSKYIPTACWLHVHVYRHTPHERCPNPPTPIIYHLNMLLLVSIKMEVANKNSSTILLLLVEMFLLPCFSNPDSVRVRTSRGDTGSMCELDDLRNSYLYNDGRGIFLEDGMASVDFCSDGMGIVSWTSLLSKGNGVPGSLSQTKWSTSILTLPLSIYLSLFYNIRYRFFYGHLAMLMTNPLHTFMYTC